jgi:LPXTG-motif cell wall-anchored protein
LLTATAAGTLLGALWFVPSATATPGESDSADARTASAVSDVQTDRELRLADTGSIDTTPYVLGGAAFLGLGVGFVAYSVRRERGTGAGAAVGAD